MTDPFEENIDEVYYDRTLLKRLLAYLRPYWLQVATAVAMMFGVTLCSLAGPYLTKIAIDEHIRVGDFSGLDGIALVYLGVLLATFVLQFFQTLLMQYIGQKVMYDMRTEVFAHIHKMSFHFFERTPIGKLVTRVVNDVEVLNELLSSALVMILNDIFTLFGIFIILAYLDIRLTLVVCLAFPFLYLAAQAYRARARDALRKMREHITRLNAFLSENLSGMATVQLFGREESHYRRFEKINNDKLAEDTRLLVYNACYLPSIDLFNALGIGLVVWYGGGRFVQDNIPLGVLVAFLQYLQKFFDPIRDLAEKFNIVQGAMTSCERIFALLDTPEEVTNPAEPRVAEIGPEQGSRVEFKNVWFAYRDEQWVLKDVSFTLAAGESLAIVGTTGSGKTTIINTLCRFYDIQKGEILLDGSSVGAMDKYRLRRRIALVQQDVFLFSGSVLDNIRLGNDNLDEAAVAGLAQTTNSHRFIEGLPDRYRQEVREGGNLLSLGQKQLLSFTRALAFNPHILVLDEATSSVDTETELLVRDAVRRLVQGRTSIIIAHRLSTIMHADKVLVLKHGRVEEFGTRAELLKKKGVFYKLYNMQAGQLESAR
jgi:ATP-binding cassette subfamily B protein